jgi:hypothetical protein
MAQYRLASASEATPSLRQSGFPKRVAHDVAGIAGVMFGCDGQLDPFVGELFAIVIWRMNACARGSLGIVELPSTRYRPVTPAGE